MQLPALVYLVSRTITISSTLAPLQAKTKEAEALVAQAKEQEALLAQKQRQIDGLVEGMERRPGASSGATGENVAMARLKEKMAAEVTALKAAQEQVNQRLKGVRLAPTMPCCTHSEVLA